MIAVIKGSNTLLPRPTYNSDGTVLAPSTLTSCSCELRQKGVVMRTLVLGTDDELRINDDDTGLLLELTTEITAALDAGRLTERYRLEIPNAAYEAQPDEEIPKVDVQQVIITE